MSKHLSANLLLTSLLLATAARAEVGNEISAVFTVDTRYGFSVGTEVSGLFTVDTRPRLAVERAGANVVLSWPATASGFVLETRATLAASPAWATVTNSPSLSDLRQYVTNAISGQGQFYRLRRN